MGFNGDRSYQRVIARLSDSPPRILITRFSSIGDIVLTTPIIRAVSARFPGASIHFATKAAYKELLSNNPFIARLHLLDDDWQSFAASFEGLHFDYFIDLHKNLRTQRLRSVIASDRYVSFDKKNFDKWLLVNFKINRLKGDGLLTRYFRSLLTIDVTYDNRGLDFHLGDLNGYTEVDDQLPGHEFDALVLGGKHSTKKAPVEKLIPVLRNKKRTTVLLGGDSEFAEAKQLEVVDDVVNFTGKLSLTESAYVLSKAQKVATNDTGLMHIAAAFDKDLAVLWGSTVREFGFSPVKSMDSTSDTIHFENEGLNCRPCSKLGHSKCPKGHFNCMMDLDYSRLTDWFNR